MLVSYNLFDTYDMQMCDPMSEEVAIVGISNGYCLLIDSLGKSSKIAAVKKVWKLRKKSI